jgi:hypothetical protein
MTQLTVRPLFQWHNWPLVSCFNDTTARESAVSMTQLTVSQLFQWHHDSFPQSPEIANNKNNARGNTLKKQIKTTSKHARDFKKKTGRTELVFLAGRSAGCDSTYDLACHYCQNLQFYSDNGFSGFMQTLALQDFYCYYINFLLYQQ